MEEGEGALCDGFDAVKLEYYDLITVYYSKKRGKSLFHYARDQFWNKNIPSKIEKKSISLNLCKIQLIYSKQLM